MLLNNKIKNRGDNIHKSEEKIYYGMDKQMCSCYNVEKLVKVNHKVDLVLIRIAILVMKLTKVSYRNNYVHL